MTVLITGACGVIGAFLMRRLITQDVRPVAYDLRPDTSLVPDLLDRFDFVQGDVLDLPRLFDTIKRYRVDRIVHTASLLTPQAQANPPLAVRVNVEGTVHVLEAARLFGLRRVVFTSSKAVYGDITGEHAHPTYVPYDEEYRREPYNVYDAAKQMCEVLGLNYRREHGIDFIALRFSTPYGPGRLVRHSKVATSRMIESAAAGVPFVLPQGGDQRSDFVYLKDVVEALVLACFVDQTEHAVFNIGFGSGTSMRDLAEAVRGAIPDAQITVGPGLDYLGAGRPIYGVMDIRRAQRELGYAPRFDFGAAVRDYLATLEALGLVPIAGGV